MPQDNVPKGAPAPITDAVPAASAEVPETTTSADYYTCVCNCSYGKRGEPARVKKGNKMVLLTGELTPRQSVMLKSEKRLVVATPQ